MKSFLFSVMSLHGVIHPKAEEKQVSIEFLNSNILKCVKLFGIKNTEESSVSLKAQSPKVSYELYNRL